jgi:hypothetical protein
LWRRSNDFLLEDGARLRRLRPVLTRRRIAMVREWQFLSVMFVFAFLGAIVMGVF